MGYQVRTSRACGRPVKVPRDRRGPLRGGPAGQGDAAGNDVEKHQAERRRGGNRRGRPHRASAGELVPQRACGYGDQTRNQEHIQGLVMQLDNVCGSRRGWREPLFSAGRLPSGSRARRQAAAAKKYLLPAGNRRPLHVPRLTWLMYFPAHCPAICSPSKKPSGPGQALAGENSDTLLRVRRFEPVARLSP